MVMGDLALEASERLLGRGHVAILHRLDEADEAFHEAVLRVVG